MGDKYCRLKSSKFGINGINPFRECCGGGGGGGGSGKNNTVRSSTRDQDCYLKSNRYFGTSFFPNIYQSAQNCSMFCVYSWGTCSEMYSNIYHIVLYKIIIKKNKTKVIESLAKI